MRTNQDNCFWHQNDVNKELIILDEQSQHMVMFSQVIKLMSKVTNNNPRTKSLCTDPLSLLMPLNRHMPNEFLLTLMIILAT